MNRAMRWIPLAALAAMNVACQSEGPALFADEPEADPQGLSTPFLNACANCHGPEGRGRGLYPPIPGGRSEAGYIEVVRTGRGAMTAFDETRISDEELKSDYRWLTTVRP